MTTSTGPGQRRAYDHRLREQVCRTGIRALDRHRLRIPRSTIATWRQRGLRPVVTAEPFELDRQQLLATIDKLHRRARILAAVVRLLLALLRVSRFRLDGQRLPRGQDKAIVLRAVATAQPALPLAAVLRVLRIPPSRYRA